MTALASSFLTCAALKSPFQLSILGVIQGVFRLCKRRNFTSGKRLPERTTVRYCHVSGYAISQSTSPFNCHKKTSHMYTAAQISLFFHALLNLLPTTYWNKEIQKTEAASKIFLSLYNQDTQAPKLSPLSKYFFKNSLHLLREFSGFHPLFFAKFLKFVIYHNFQPTHLCRNYSPAVRNYLQIISHLVGSENGLFIHPFDWQAAKKPFSPGRFAESTFSLIQALSFCATMMVQTFCVDLIDF